MQHADAADPAEFELGERTEGDFGGQFVAALTRSLGFDEKAQIREIFSLRR